MHGTHMPTENEQAVLRVPHLGIPTPIPTYQLGQCLRSLESWGKRSSYLYNNHCDLH